MLLIGAFLAVLLGIISCSENPYTGSMMQPGDLDKYLSHPGGGKVCLSNGSDSVCVTLYPKRGDQFLPIIHIHPSSTTYVFYYKGKVIVQAERVSDNTDLIDEIIDDKQPESDRPPRDESGGQQPPGSIGGGGSGQTPPNNNVGTDGDGTDNGGTVKDDPNNDNGVTVKDDPNNNDGNMGDPNNNGNIGGPNDGGTNNGDPNNGGTDNGGTDNGGTNNGGTNNGGTNNGGTNNGGTDNGGTNNGGTDNGGTNNGGTNNGGTDNGGTNNGGTVKDDPNNDNGVTVKDDPNNNDGNMGDPKNNGNIGGPNDGGTNNGGTNNGGTNNGGTNNGGTNNGGTNNGGTNNGGTNNGDTTNGRNNGGTNNGGDTTRNNPNPSGHNPPDNVLSHLVYGHADDDPVHPTHVDGWIVWIYYPHNYADLGLPLGLGMGPIDPQTGPASVDDPITTDRREDYGFTFSVTGGEVRNFSQTSGECTDELRGPPPTGDSVDNRAAGQDNRDDLDDTPCSSTGSDYSTQMFIKTSANKITITIKWTHGMYAGQTQIFNIMKEVSMADYDDPNYDPGHLNQHRWD